MRLILWIFLIIRLMLWWRCDMMPWFRDQMYGGTEARYWVFISKYIECPILISHRKSSFDFREKLLTQHESTTSMRALALVQDNKQQQQKQQKCIIDLYMNWLVRMNPLLISDLLFVEWLSYHYCPNSMLANDVTDLCSMPSSLVFAATICPSLIWKRTETALKTNMWTTEYINHNEGNIETKTRWKLNKIAMKILW